MTLTTPPKAPRQRKTKAAAPALSEAIAPVPSPQRKIDLVIALLRRDNGATLDEIVAATGWRRHSARGALAAAVPKKLGGRVTVELTDGVRRYRASEAAR
ncbi:DUF3489 domain-containing protein [Brevundimonas sp. KM4]|uniref:DUF3489 domain-containing protein n=1 Tax=Brevundimonas sp. KM4 TaxID=1628191 RepID=UPI0009E5AD8F|nr:DUF3489 domain-containing protein [Brevundimonas sp. KM4]